MTRLTRHGRWASLLLLTIFTGCTLPSGRDDAAAVTAAAPMRSLQDNSTERQPISLAVQDTSLVSYDVLTDAAPTPPTTTDESTPPSQGLPLTPIQPVPTAPQLKAAPPLEAGTATPSDPSSWTPCFSNDPCDPFNNQEELSIKQLLAEVQARNPSLQAASAAWWAATERCPQAAALDDPMFTSMIGPKGVGADHGGGWMVQASQKVPWAGKRALRGNAASAEADAMRGDIGDVRLRLSEATRTAFYDYYLARRETAVNESTRQLVAQFRTIAWDKYQVNQATQQDVLQADVELATLESRQTELTRDEQIAIARINTLLNRAADCPLPPPPARLPLPDFLPTTECLQQTAESRPDLFAMLARIRAEEANTALACKEYYPDLNLVAKYDGFMPEEMRPQVGMELNVPLQQCRRSAAVREASYRLQQRRAEYQDRLNQVRFEVHAAVSRALQSQQNIRLYEEKILPATQRSVESAQSNYTSGTLDFLRLVDAERQVYSQQAMYYQAIAEYHRRLAELERVVGGSLPELVGAM